MKMSTEDFLWYSYFGITKTVAQKRKEENEEDVLGKCINKAYADFRRTIDYRYSISELSNLSEDKNEDFKKEKDEFKTQKKNIICDGVRTIIELGQNKLELADENQVQFDRIHKDICDSICGEDNALKTQLTYGQAQKWVNMTLKYMMIMGLWEELERLKIYLHVPLDNYIFKAIRSFDKKCIGPTKIKEQKHDEVQYQVWFDRTTKELITAQDRINRKNGQEKLAWSKIDYQVYKNIQKMIVANIGDECRYDWEFRIWLEEVPSEKSKIDSDLM